MHNRELDLIRELPRYASGRKKALSPRKIQQNVIDRDGEGCTRKNRVKKRQHTATYLGSRRADQRRGKSAVQPPPSLVLHDLRSTRRHATDSVTKRWQRPTTAALAPTSSIWRTAPSLAADFDETRAVCWRVFTWKDGKFRD